MARYKAQDRNSLLLPIVLSEQIVPGSAKMTASNGAMQGYAAPKKP